MVQEIKGWGGGLKTIHYLHSQKLSNFSKIRTCYSIFMANNPKKSCKIKYKEYFTSFQFFTFTTKNDEEMWHCMLQPKTSSWILNLDCNLLSLTCCPTGMKFSYKANITVPYSRSDDYIPHAFLDRTILSYCCVWAPNFGGEKGACRGQGTAIRLLSKFTLTWWRRRKFQPSVIQPAAC